MKIVHSAFLTIAALFCFAANADTLTWTGAAGDNRWLTYSNWSGATASTDFSLPHDYVFNNLADGADIKLAKYNNQTLIIKSLTMTMSSPSTRSWTFSGVDGNARVRTLSSGTITIAQGCTLTITAKTDNPWNSTYNAFTLTGGGALRMSTQWESWGGVVYINDATFICNDAAAAPQAGLGDLYYMLQSDKAVFKLERNSFGHIKGNTEGTYPTIMLNDFQFLNSCNQNYSYSGAIVGSASSTFGVMYPHSFTITSSPASLGTFAVYNGDLLFGSAASPVTLTSEAKLDVRRMGNIKLFSDQTIAAINGVGSTGTIDIPTGKKLTLTGTAGEMSSTTYNARLTGGGDLVKRGAAYELQLTGDSTAFTGRVQVAEGTLLLSHGDLALDDDIVFYSPFENQTFNTERLTGEKYSKHTIWSTTPISYIAEPDIERGEGVFGDCIRCGNKGVKDTRWVMGTEKTCTKKINRSNWTVSFWIKPDGVSNTGWRSGHIFNLGTWSDTENPYILALIQFEYNKTTGVKRIRDYSSNVVTRDLDLLDGNWHHVVYIQEPRAKYIWVDGKLEAKETDFSKDIFITAANIQIGGKDTWGINSAYCGLLDELIVANGSWSEERILREYNRCVAPEAAVAKPLPKPAARWTFDEDYNDHIGGIEMKTIGTADPAIVTMPGASGKCLHLKKNSALQLKGPSYPANLPTGKKPFTVSIRHRFNNTGEFTSSFTMGDVSTVDRFIGGGIAGGNRYSCLWWRKVKSKSTSCAFDYCPNSIDSFTPSLPVSWDHMVAAYDGTNVACYIDGHLRSTVAATTLDMAGGTVYFGYDPYAVEANATNFLGWVDDVAVWTNCCLNANQCREVVRSFQRDFQPVGQLVNAAVTIEADGLLKTEGVGNAVKSLSGTGEIQLTRSSALMAGASDFAGKLVGQGLVELTDGSDLSASSASDFFGVLRLNGGASLLNPTYAQCTVRLATGGVTGGAAPVEVLEGATLSINVAAQDVAGVSTTGRLTLPMEATVVLNGDAPEGDMLIAEAGTMVAPSDFSKWHLPGGAGRYRLRVKDNKLYLVIRRGIAVIYF